MTQIQIIFNGEPMMIADGQSVGAFLLEHGERSTRTTRFGLKPRGMFCGIGICFDCLVTVNGVANQRACITRVREDMSIQTQDGAGTLE
jgi:predicted molibdopterin-dependent oxidoreductase YjgC